MSIDPKSFLFVCGCPRSGTTALWQMLMGSTDIFLGIERYASYMARRNIGKLNRELYLKDRFFDLQSDDTHYDDLATFHVFEPYYASAQDDYDKARFIGDKIPRLYNDFNQFESRFPDAKVIFVVRNVYDVCVSYQRRKDNNKDAWSLGHEKAVEDWNESIRRYQDSVGREFTGCVVEYEKLFNVEDSEVRETAVRQLIDFTGATDGENLLKTHENLMRVSRNLEQKRDAGKLDAQAKRHILLNADTDGYRRLLEQ